MPLSRGEPGVLALPGVDESMLPDGEPIIVKSGFVVNGIGYGKATLAKPKVDWTVRVE